MHDNVAYYNSIGLLPQCMLCAGLYSEDKSPSERVELVDGAIAKFKEAIAILEEDRNEGVAAPPAYKIQSRLARCLYNKNSLLNQLAQRDPEIQYSDQQKEEVYSAMCDAANSALRGATAAGDTAERQSMDPLRDFPSADPYINECNDDDDGVMGQNLDQHRVLMTNAHSIFCLCLSKEKKIHMKLSAPYTVKLRVNRVYPKIERVKLAKVGRSWLTSNPLG